MTKNGTVKSTQLYQFRYMRGQKSKLGEGREE